MPHLKEYLTPRNVFYGLLGLILVPLFVIVLYTAWVVSEGLPTFEQLENPRPELATQVVSADGELLGQFYIKQRRYMTFDSIPKDFINALIATEDREFYNHWGIHTMRVFKAAVKNVLAFRSREGASTLTQQLARALYLSPDKSLSRKIKEAFTALELERTHTKREILELYINTVHYGRSADGLQVAAQAYFDKTPQQMNLAECAFLVGIVQRPARYERNYEAAINRRNLVLSLMRDQKYITESAYTAARATQTVPVATSTVIQTQTQTLAPHFVEMIRQKLREPQAIKDFNLRGYDVYRDGLVIHTTLNSRMQTCANKAVEEHLDEFQPEFNRFWRWDAKKQKRNDEGDIMVRSNQVLLNDLVEKAAKTVPGYNKATTADARAELIAGLKRNDEFMAMVKREALRIQTGFVCIEHASGEIRAMVGSSNFGKDSRYSLNRVTQIRRQPGSSFKPFVYACALANGASPYTRIESSHLSTPLPDGKTWELEGRGGDEDGRLSLVEALRASVNTVAARLIMGKTRPSEVIRTVRKAGFKSDLDAVASLALGSEEVSPMEMVGGYTVFPNQGVYIEPYFISRIEDRFGNVIYDHARKPSAVNEVFKPRVARDMVMMMRNVVNSGTGSKVRRWFPYEAAGKTGTTNDFTDAWFVGFTPQLTAGVWTGFDDQRVKFTGRYGEGGSAAAPIWARFMAKIYRDQLLRYKSSMRFENDFSSGSGGSSGRSSGNSSSEEESTGAEPNPESSAPPDSTGGW
jgi:penicillin-binding protein 1A